MTDAEPAAAANVTPGVAAIVINWNGRDYLPECLDSVLAQQPPPDEVLLVDNHSSDGSRELVAERYPQVRVIDTGNNIGPGNARNVGVEHARFSTCLLVDNDIVLRPGALDAMRRRLASDEHAAMVQVRSLCSDRPDLVHYDASDLHFLGTLILHNWFRPLAEASRPTAPMGGGISLCFLARRDAWLEVGGFNPAIFFFFEDTDFVWRLRIKGYTVWLEPDALALHRGGTAGLSMRGEKASYPARRTYHHTRNRWLMLLTCMRWRTLVLTAPAQFVYTLVYLAFATARGHLVAALRGHLSVLPMLPEVLRWRRRAQADRRVGDRELLVAAPLTYNPGLADRGFKAFVRSALDRFYIGWWRVVRGLCG